MSRRRVGRPRSHATASDLGDLLLDELRRRHIRRPPARDIYRLMEAMFAASLLTEEGSAIRMQATWLDPARPDPYPPPRVRRSRWTWVALDVPVSATAASLAKVALSSDPRSSWLGIYASGGTLSINGFVDLQTVTDEFVNQESESVFPPPGVFQVRVAGIGHLQVMLGHVMVGELRGGAIAGASIDVFERGVIRARLRPAYEAHRREVADSLPDYTAHEVQELNGVFEDNWFRAVRRILLQADRYAHGGAFLITNDETFEYLDVKYKLNYRRLRVALVNQAEYVYRRYALTDHVIDAYLRTGRRTMPVDTFFDVSIAEDELQDSTTELTGVTRFISLLSRVDGAVILNPRLELLGFGAEIKQDDLPTEIRRATLASAGPASLRTADYSHFGTRHRSMMRYCWAKPGSVGFVVSKDGGVRAITRVDDAVVLWEGLQLLKEWDTARFDRQFRRRHARRA
jgi:hypothetical protein